jgi:hypothetical protein
MRGEGVIDNILITLVVATSAKFSHLHLVRDDRNGGWDQGSNDWTEISK